jgi:hypothetical protein
MSLISLSLSFCEVAFERCERWRWHCRYHAYVNRSMDAKLLSIKMYLSKLILYHLLYQDTPSSDRKENGEQERYYPRSDDSRV